MKTRNVPHPADALKDLEGFLPPLFEVLEGAALEAREYFAQRGEAVNIWTYCALFRHCAKPLLRAHGFNPQELNNNGLCVSYGRYSVKIYKRYNGEVPPPGPSRLRQNFYKQIPRQLFLLKPSILRMLEIGPVNLLITWEPGPQYDLAALNLACPKNGTYNPSSVDLYWDVSIPHPALSLTPDRAAYVQDDLDVDITLREEDEPGTGTEQTE